MSGYRIRNIVLLLTILAVISVNMAACASPAPEVIEKEVIIEKVVTVAVEATPAGAERVVRIVETKPERFEIIDVSKIRARNCVGGNLVRFGESLSKSTSEEVTVGGRASVTIAFVVTVALEAVYHVTKGHRIEKTVEFEVEGQPGKNLEYPVVWKEVWTDGYAVVEMSDGSQIQVDYSVRHSLQGELLDAIDIGCE